MRLFALLVPALALSLGVVACSGADPDPVSEEPSTNEVQSQLVDEGHECSAENKCKPGLVCVARVAGGDVGTRGVPCAGDGCGTSSSSGSTTSSSSSGWSSSSSSGSTSGSTTSSSGWSSSSGSTTSSSGWSSSSGSTGSSSGWSSSSGGTSSSSGATPGVGVCITIH